MADISNRTLAILIVAILVTSLLSTWLILSQRSYDMSWFPQEDRGVGIVKLYIEGAEVGEQAQDGQVRLVVLPQAAAPVAATPG